MGEGQNIKEKIPMHTIENFIHMPGIFYEQIGKLHLSNNIYTIAATTDVQPLLKRIGELQSYMIITGVMNSKIPSGDNFKRILEQWSYELSETMIMIEGLLGTNVTRSRRGLIDGIGSIAKSLFGTMDAGDAKEIHTRLKMLENGQGNTINANKKQIEIINSTIWELERTEEIIQKNEQALLKSTNELSQLMTWENNILKIREDLGEHIMLIEITLNEIKRDTLRIRNLLTKKSENLIETGILTEKRLLELIHKAQLPKGLSFPVGITLQDMYQIESIATISTHTFGNKIVSLIEIPLINYEVFKVFKTHSVPVKTTEKIYSYFKPENELLVVHEATQRFIPMSTQQLKECGNFNEHYLCTQVLPKQAMRSYSPCEVQLFANSKVIPNTCTPIHVSIQHLTLIQMQKENAFIFVSPLQEEIFIKCEDQEVRRTLIGTGIIQVDNFCEIIATDFSVKGRKTTGIELEQHVQPRINLTLDKETQQNLKGLEGRIKDIHLGNVVQNMQELKGLQKQLGWEQKELDNAKQDLSIHEIFTQPSNIVSSVTIILVLTFGIIFFSWYQKNRTKSSSISGPV